MEELEIDLKSLLRDLQNTVEEFVSFNRNDKKILYDIYISEFTSLVMYFEQNSIPESFKRNELNVLHNKINDDLRKLKKLLCCYSDFKEKKYELESDFDIVDKSSVLYHHLTDLTHIMEIHLGFDQADKYRSLESLFDTVNNDIKNNKKKKHQDFLNELTELKDSIEASQSIDKAKLIKEVDSLLDELHVSGIFNQQKAFLIKNDFDLMNRNMRKESLRKIIISRVRSRLLGKSNINHTNDLLVNFDMELENIKNSVNTLLE